MAEDYEIDVSKKRQLTSVIQGVADVCWLIPVFDTNPASSSSQDPHFYCLCEMSPPPLWNTPEGQANCVPRVCVKRNAGKNGQLPILLLAYVVFGICSRVSCSQCKWSWVSFERVYSKCSLWKNGGTYNNKEYHVKPLIITV